MAAKHIDINTASEEELAQFPAIGEDRAQILVAQRPFHDWSEVDDLPGFSPTIVDELQQQGAYLGGQIEETGVIFGEDLDADEDAW
jgi:DNA uptake protein ComE-like DNA-binding protein